MTYAVILAARMSSERLPGKAAAELVPGLPVLTQLIRRWKASDRAPVVVVTTTTDRADDEIERMAHAAGVPCSRGDPRNVVAQMDTALKRHAPRAEYVARALADNPLVDVGLADWRLDVLRDTGADGITYGTEWRDGVEHSRHDRITYAATTDVWSRRAWDRIVAGSQGADLEHPGNFYWRNLSQFTRVELPLPRDEYREDLHHIRTELDEQADLDVFRAVWTAWRGPDLPPTLWALGYLRTHPAVAVLNRKVVIKTQSAIAYPKHFKNWRCPNCDTRMGSVVEGGLRVPCGNCGTTKTFYATAPQRGGLVIAAS